MMTLARSLHRLLALVGTLCFAALALAHPASSWAQELGPLSQRQFTYINDSGSRWMESNATLQRGSTAVGQLDVVTRTHNTVLLSGYTGGVYILLRNANDAVIGVTDLHTFGVDGKWVGAYDRTDYWQAYVAPQVAAATVRLEIIQTHAPQDRIPAILDRIAEYKRQACQNFPELGC
jgi:hypothetical protein